MRKFILSLIFIGCLVSIASAQYYRTYAIIYDTTTVESNMYLKGNYYLIDSTESLTAVIDNNLNPLNYSDIAFESGTNYPLKLYNGDLKIMTIGNGITFPDGSLQTTAGVGSAYNTLSSTGTIVINSDSDASGNENIYFRTNGANNRMIIDYAGNVGVGTDYPNELLQVGKLNSNNNLLIPRSYVQEASDTVRSSIILGNTDRTTVGVYDTWRWKISSVASSWINPNYGYVSGYNDDLRFIRSIRDADAPDYTHDETVMTLRADGVGNNYVGIGTTEPIAKLDVNGAIGLESLITLDYDDVNYELDISTDIHIKKILIDTTTRYYMISGADFVHEFENKRYYSAYLMNISSDCNNRYMTSLHLPVGAIITKVTAYWNRTDSLSVGTCDIYRYALTSSSNDSIASVDANATTGYFAVEESSPTNNIISENYSYWVSVNLLTNDAANDVYLLGVKITYTIDSPLP